MKTHLFIGLFCAAVVTARAQSTAFLYQGGLAANGSPFSGLAEMQFTLFGAPAGGVAVATNTPAIASVNVSRGSFAVALDFGAAAFPGKDRWLEVQVRTTLGAFATLTPRQPLTPAPYALYAHTAEMVLGQWVPSGSDLSYTVGRVGIGTDSPVTGLDVRGDIRLGASGQFRAAGGEENLRIIRGSVDYYGRAIEGEGFHATRISEGDYLIDFFTPFMSDPTVTATVDDDNEALFLSHYLVASVFSPNTASVRVRTRHLSASSAFPTGALSSKFHFIAVGPR